MNKNKAYKRDFKSVNNLIVGAALKALKDDIGTGDITTQALNIKIQKGDAIIVAKSKGILCGLFEAKAIFEEGGLNVVVERKEGESIEKGNIVAKVSGNINEILSRERTALNYLQVLSGIATTTYNLTQHFPSKISSLRKTHPGIGYSEKRAVQIGGGYSHRLALFDGFLIKDNHIAAVARELFGDIKIIEKIKIKALKEALLRVKAYRKNSGLEDYFIEIEVESIPQVLALIQLFKKEGVPEIIMLDNMEIAEVKKSVKLIKNEIGENILIEASGSITPDNIVEYIKCGVDIVSISYLTFGSKPLDFSLNIVGYK